MTTLAPSPAEQAEIDRFGAFDEEKFAEIIEHHDDALHCSCFSRGKRCGREATHIATCRMCGLSPLLICAFHADYFSNSPQEMTHRPCGVRGPLAEMLRVVQL